MQDIKGYEGKYAVTKDGHIYSYYSKRYLSEIDNKGYSYVKLRNGMGRQKFCSIHRLVAQAYLPNPNNFPEVNHKDENKKNNDVSNLEWCDRSYNVNYGTGKDRQIKTQQKNSPKRKKVLCVETGIVYSSQMEAKRLTGIDNGRISHCCRGEEQTAGGYHWQYI